MTFSFVAAGHKDYVRRTIAAQVEQSKQWNNDTTQAEKVQALIDHHLDNSEFGGGVFVHANGHHDGHVGALELKIQPIFLPTGIDGPLDLAPTGLEYPETEEEKAGAAAVDGDTNGE